MEGASQETHGSQEPDGEELDRAEASAAGSLSIREEVKNGWKRRDGKMREYWMVNEPQQLTDGVALSELHRHITRLEDTDSLTLQ